MKNGILFLALVGSLAVLTGPATAGVPVTVTVTGEVEFNQINSPPLGDVLPGETATLTFLVDSDVFDDDPVFPTRGYVIDEWSYSLTFDSADMELEDPFPAGQTPYFVIRNDDPAVDGFFTATNTAVPFGAGLPLNQTGLFGQFQDSFRVTYEGDTLASLDILGALGTYDFDGLTVFGWTIDDGPFNAMFIIFNELTIEVVPMDEDGDGVLDPDDLCAGTVIPEGVPTHRLGTNRWALVDEDSIFDTTHPNGNGPGFMFDLEDTAGCSCEQIIEMLGLGIGHTKFGCSNSAMLNWVSMASGADYGVDIVPTDPTKSADDRLAGGND
ncbi:MAG: hypothetical protein OEQ13_05750 [Acidobacteriota bacterium]|nr:hypothetical protein [Acidobacteriota bacterium]